MCKLPHHVQDLVDHLGVQCRSGFVEEHDLGLHGQRPGDGHPLLLPTRELSRELAGLLRDAHALQKLIRNLLSPCLRPLADLLGCKRDVLHDRQVREQVERLEHHSHFLADGVHVPYVA